MQILRREDEDKKNYFCGSFRRRIRLLELRKVENFLLKCQKKNLHAAPNVQNITQIKFWIFKCETSEIHHTISKLMANLF